MIFDQGPGGFGFYNQHSIHEQVDLFFADERSVFVEDFDDLLLLHLASEFSESVGKRILVDPLAMPMAVVAVDRVSGGPNSLTEVSYMCCQHTYT